MRERVNVSVIHVVLALSLLSPRTPAFPVLLAPSPMVMISVSPVLWENILHQQDRFNVINVVVERKHSIMERVVHSVRQVNSQHWMVHVKVVRMEHTVLMQERVHALPAHRDLNPTLLSLPVMPALQALIPLMGKTANAALPVNTPLNMEPLNVMNAPVVMKKIPLLSSVFLVLLEVIHETMAHANHAPFTPSLHWMPPAPAVCVGPAMK